MTYFVARLGVAHASPCRRLSPRRSLTITMHDPSADPPREHTNRGLAKHALQCKRRDRAAARARGAPQPTRQLVPAPCGLVRPRDECRTAAARACVRWVEYMRDALGARGALLIGVGECRGIGGLMSTSEMESVRAMGGMMEGSDVRGWMVGAGVVWWKSAAPVCVAYMRAATPRSVACMVVAQPGAGLRSSSAGRDARRERVAIAGSSRVTSWARNAPCSLGPACS
jgi:hypothetical protein